jgi:hypothetical protein
MRDAIVEHLIFIFNSKLILNSITEEYCIFLTIMYYANHYLRRVLTIVYYASPIIIFSESFSYYHVLCESFHF